MPITHFRVILKTPNHVLSFYRVIKVLSTNAQCVYMTYYVNYNPSTYENKNLIQSISQNLPIQEISIIIDHLYTFWGSHLYLNIIRNAGFVTHSNAEILDRLNRNQHPYFKCFFLIFYFLITPSIFMNYRFKLLKKKRRRENRHYCPKSLIVAKINLGLSMIIRYTNLLVVSN